MCAVAHDFYAMMRTQCKYTIAGNKQMFIRLRARLRVFVLKCRGFFFHFNKIAFMIIVD